MNIARWIDDRLGAALRKTSGRMDGRLIVVAMLCAYFALLFAGSLLRHRPYYQTWRAFGVPAMSFSKDSLTTNSFADLRSILSCYDCTRLGYDVLVINPCNPNQTGKGATPYPRIWWTLTPLGLSQSHTIALALFLTGAFYGTVLLLAGKLTLGEGVVYGLFLCSPPIMTLVERCNVDNIIFMVLFVALCLSAWGRTLAARLCAYFLIFLAALFKIYPLAGLMVLLKEKGRTRLFLAALFAALFVAYYLSHLTEMRMLRAVAGDADQLSYGYKIIFFRIIKLLNGNRAHPMLRPLKHLMGILLALTFAGAMLVLARQIVMAFRNWAKRPYVAETTEQDTDGRAALRLDGFRLGAALYLLTFALGSVFSYKLVFLLFTLPQILAWIKAEGPFSRVSSLALAGLLTMFYLLHIFAVSFDQIIDWLLVGYFACGLVFTLPGEWKQWVHHLISRKPSPAA